MGSTQIELREVSGKSDLKAFISVPWSVYRDDPNWAPPLKFERKQAWSEKNPFFQHARWKAWIAYRDGQPVGRISAQVDDLYLELHDAHTGFFGLIEAQEDPAIFEALFGAAEGWLKEQGMRTVLGPFNLNINQEIGCLVEGFDTPPYVMMGHARPYYGPSIERQGYEKAEDTFSYILEEHMFHMPEKIDRLLARLSGKITLRQVDRKNAVAELETMRSIFNDAWSENWGFVPFTKDEFQAVGKELFMIVPPDFTWIAETGGEPAAFHGDDSEFERGGGRFKRQAFAVWMGKAVLAAQSAQAQNRAYRPDGRAPEIPEYPSWPGTGLPDHRGAV